MMLVGIIALLILGGLVALVVGRVNEFASRLISLLAILLSSAWFLAWWLGSSTMATGSQWLLTFYHPWLPSLGINFHFALDGMSLLMILLTFFIGIISVLISWREIDERVGFFHFNLLWTLAGVVGVFLAVDLFLFYFFWEMMLIPMYLLIAIWGHENRRYAATKFFLFTQFGGLLMLAAIVTLALWRQSITGILSFDYFELLNTPLSFNVEFLLMLGFFIAFAIKLPMFPLHTWLPDAHTEAPTAGSVILAALLLKTGAYGLIRFVIPLFPNAARIFAPYAIALGVIGILYGAILAFAQTDLKRLVAYTSVSHLGFVLLGVFAFTELAMQGAVMQMISHGLSTGALFVLVGLLYERIHTRDITRMGGLWTVAPRIAAMALFFAMASLGLPGLGNFIAEFLTLVGAFHASVFWTVLATIGVVFATVYSLYLFQRTFHGAPMEKWSFADLSAREAVSLGLMAIGLVYLGLFPQGVFDLMQPVIDDLRQATLIASTWMGR